MRISRRKKRKPPSDPQMWRVPANLHLLIRCYESRHFRLGKRRSLFALGTSHLTKHRGECLELLWPTTGGVCSKLREQVAIRLLSVDFEIARHSSQCLLASLLASILLSVRLPCVLRLHACTHALRNLDRICQVGGHRDENVRCLWADSYEGIININCDEEKHF